MHDDRVIDDPVSVWHCCHQRVKPKGQTGKQVSSQLVNKILFPYMTGRALVFTFEKKKGWDSKSVSEWIIV